MPLALFSTPYVILQQDESRPFVIITVGVNVCAAMEHLQWVPFTAWEHGLSSV